MKVVITYSSLELAEGIHPIFELFQKWLLLGSEFGIVQSEPLIEAGYAAWQLIAKSSLGKLDYPYI
jgi:hypothetical protein